MQHDILETARQYIAKGIQLPSDIRWQLTDEQWKQLALSQSQMKKEREYEPKNEASQDEKPEKM